MHCSCSHTWLTLTFRALEIVLPGCELTWEATESLTEAEGLSGQEVVMTKHGSAVGVKEIKVGQTPKKD